MQLEKLKDARGPRATLVENYLSQTQERITVFVKSIYTMRKLDPSAEMKMDRLREELRARDENILKTRLRSVNYKIDYSVLGAVTGSERVEGVWRLRLPDVNILTSVQLDIFPARLVADLATLMAHGQTKCVLRRS